jgi:VWFA-related protein
MAQRAGALALLVAIAARAAAEAEEPPAARFGESVEVRVVNVEVAVVDRDGRPVVDLERGDFRLEVDGRPVEIAHFARFAAAAAPAAAPPAAPAPPPPPAGAPAPPPPGEAQRLRLAVWLDDLHLLPAHRNRVLKELGTLLTEHERAGADLLLARYDRSFELLRNFGERARPLAADLAAAAGRTASGVFTETARRSAFEEIEAIYADDRCERVGDMLAAARRYAEPLRHESSSSLHALDATVRALAGLPGRRALLYVSDGVPLVPGQEAYLYVDQLCAGKSATEQKETLVDDLRRLAAEANAAGVTFYTLQAGGLPVGGGAELSGRGLDWTNEFAARANLTDPLQALAAATGGRALLESNRLRPLLDSLARDLATGYSLGFTPAGAPDGREHRIAVKVARAGARVRHRASYRDRTSAEQRDARLVAALRFGGAANPLGVRLEVDAARAADGAGALVPVRIVVPAAGVLFLGAAPGEATARLELALAATDERGGLSPIRSREVAVERAQLGAAPETAQLRFPVDLRLRKGHARIAALVRDLSAQTESVVWTEVAVR